MPPSPVPVLDSEPDLEAPPGTLGRLLPWLASLPTCRQFLTAAGDGAGRRADRPLQVAPLS
jgi:hypothetical protein